MKMLKVGLWLLSLVLLTGCWRIGPDKLAMDRFSYTGAIGNSWKDEMLLNLVKFRYADAPVFLGVQSVISQYTLTGSVNVSGGWSGDSVPATPWNWMANLAGHAQYTDRPTISYAPLTGSKFGQSMMTPLPPSAIVGLLQAGYAAPMILRLSVHSINGLQNPFGYQAKDFPADADFYRLLDLIKTLQEGSLLGMQVKMANNHETSLLMTIAEPRTEDHRRASDELRSLLGLDPKAREFPIIYAAFPTKKNEVAMLTRSMFDVLSDLSGYIEVPPQHLAEGRAFPSRPPASVMGRPIAPLLQIHSGVSKPDDAFVAVRYKDQWFWVDDRDIDSKMTFSFLMFMFTLVESHDAVPPPSVVLPTN